MTLRKAVNADLNQVLDLFRDTVTFVNSRDYSPMQLKAWRSSADDRARWLKKITDQYFQVATSEEKIMGFASITRSGHLDTLFVHKDHQKEGIASSLMDSMIQYAAEMKCSKVTTEGSITAKPFFEKFGFKVIGEQLVNRKGIELKNYKMVKLLKL